MPPLHWLEMPLKPDHEDPGQGAASGSTAVPIMAPHEVLAWLLDNKLISLEDSDAKRFWEHHVAVQTPYLDKAATCKDGFTVHPLTIYGDEAEYTQTKQKLLTIFLSLSTVDLYRDCNCSYSLINYFNYSSKLASRSEVCLSSMMSAPAFGRPASRFSALERIG